MSSCMASGSRRSARRVDSTMSQNSTVTCLRSPSSALRDIRIFSARCFGVYAPGEPNCGGGVADSAVGRAHSGQNFAVAESGVPQFAQVRGSVAAHSSQNLAGSRFSCWHRGHFMRRRPRSAVTHHVAGTIRTGSSTHPRLLARCRQGYPSIWRLPLPNRTAEPSQPVASLGGLRNGVKGILALTASGVRTHSSPRARSGRPAPRARVPSSFRRTSGHSARTME